MYSTWLKKSVYEEKYIFIINDIMNYMMFIIAVKWDWILYQINIVMTYLYNWFNKINIYIAIYWIWNENCIYNDLCCQKLFI